MCTVVVRIAPDEAFPLILAANRDERLDRAWDPPGAWWPDSPEVIGGRDKTAGGTWMAINGEAVIAAVLNRPGSLGPEAGKRSRGELPLAALGAGSAKRAAERIAALEASAFRTFNLVLADRAGAIFQRASGDGPIESVALTPGVHMVTARDPDDPESPRILRYLPRFRDAAVPRPECGDWAEWIAILADRSGPPGSEINVQERAGFGTVCSSLVAIPSAGQPIWLFAAGPPDRAPFVRIGLGGCSLGRVSPR
ncbi:MAG: NRDE family protein [Acetobacteraceae bacterium]